MAQYLFCYLIKAYQLLIRPFLRGQCRFYPTCSHYAIEAFEQHGTIRGFILTVKRLSRCHPWGGQGIDLVPVSSTKCHHSHKQLKQVKA